MAQYKLYVGTLQPLGNIKYSFYSGARKCLFIYTAKKPKGEWAELPAKLMNDLTAEERLWLSECQRMITAEEMIDNAKQYAEILNTFADELEKNLRQEADAARQTVKEIKSDGQTDNAEVVQGDNI